MKLNYRTKQTSTRTISSVESLPKIRSVSLEWRSDQLKLHCQLYQLKKIFDSQGRISQQVCDKVCKVINCLQSQGCGYPNQLKNFTSILKAMLFCQPQDCPQIAEPNPYALLAWRNLQEQIRTLSQQRDFWKRKAKEGAEHQLLRDSERRVELQQLQRRFQKEYRDLRESYQGRVVSLHRKNKQLLMRI